MTPTTATLHSAAGDELVDIVDADDQVIATVPRREMRARRLRHRAVYALIQASDGRVLVHQRSHTKDIRPGAWDMAVGGVVGAGESYDEAIVRELAEEIGVVGATPTTWGGGAFGDGDGGYHARCYHLVHDGPFRFDDGEVIATRWVRPEEVVAIVGAEGVVADGVAFLLERLGVWGWRRRPR